MCPWIYRSLPVPWKLSFAALSVWHCAWGADLCRPGLACLGFGQRGHWQQMGAGGSSRGIFPTLSCLARRSGIGSLSSSKDLVLSGFWSPCLFKPGVGRSFLLLLVLGCFITPQCFPDHASAPLNSSYADFFSDSLSRSFLYCWA